MVANHGFRIRRLSDSHTQLSTIAHGRVPEPGGWNRFLFEVDDIEAVVASMRQAGINFRNDIISGVGGKQILAEDPSGNPIEVFQAA